MHGALNYRVMAIFCPEYKRMIKEYETTVSKIIYYDKDKKTNFWRISVKFLMWVPLRCTLIKSVLCILLYPYYVFLKC